MANRWFFTALLLVGSIATAITYGVGGNLVIDGAITLGTLLALVALLAQLYGPLTALSNVRVDVMTALVSFERVFEILDLPPLVRNAPDAVPVRPGDLDVEFDHVGFRYPTAAEVSLASLESVARTESLRAEAPVLHDVSLRAEPGQLVALVGPSGAGKTTITALVPRLYDVTSGCVRVGGTDVRELDLESLRDAVGVVTQDAHLFHDTIEANLRYARPDATDDEIRTALRDARILDLIDSLPSGLDTVVGDRGYRLSGGEKQRLAALAVTRLRQSRSRNLLAHALLVLVHRQLAVAGTTETGGAAQELQALAAAALQQRRARGRFRRGHGLPRQTRKHWCAYPSPLLLLLLPPPPPPPPHP